MAPPGAAASAGELEPGAELLLPAPGGTRRGEEGGGPSLHRSTTARWPPPRLAPSPWRELGRPRAAAVEGARPPAGRGGVEGLEECRSPRGGVPGRAEPCRRSGRRGAAGDARANADEYRG